MNKYINYQGNIGGVSETARGRGGGRGGGAGGGEPTPHPGGLVQDLGVVQGCGRPRPTARSSYAQADHGGEGRTVQLCTAPG